MLILNYTFLRSKFGYKRAISDAAEQFGGKGQPAQYLLSRRSWQSSIIEITVGFKPVDCFSTLFESLCIY